MIQTRASLDYPYSWLVRPEAAPRLAAGEASTSPPPPLILRPLARAQRLSHGPLRSMFMEIT